MSRIYGISDIIVGDVHPERIKGIIDVAQSLWHARDRIRCNLFPEESTHPKAARARRIMAERIDNLLAMGHPTMVIMPSMVAINHRMLIDVDDIVRKHNTRIRLIMATCRSAHFVKSALRADPEMERFIGTYHHVHMTMDSAMEQASIPQEMERLHRSLSSIPRRTMRVQTGTEKEAA